MNYNKKNNTLRGEKAILMNSPASVKPFRG